MALLIPFTRINSGLPLLSFDCGDPDLNEFLSSDALKWQKDLLAVTYCLENGEDIALYFSLSNDKISANMLPRSFWRKIKKKFPHNKHRNDYPAVKIGRFAVSNKYRCQPEHWGTKAMDFIKHWMVIDNKTGCCFLTVDAYPSAVPFYRKNGFSFLGSPEEERYKAYLRDHNRTDTIAMYFFLKTIIE